jgi:hypothetical protein
MYGQVDAGSESNEENKLFLNLVALHALSSLRQRTLHFVCTLHLCVLYILIIHSIYFPAEHSPHDGCKLCCL